ncbi:hypothetical protein [Ramlibacter albus]|uniref:Uncharacterized protein n=1 Tax=Ramlibacter albus TaxID=2079448 RepID=A0A923M3N1_9BURK|nr:hypothetical protein [Ramlibacter albus]MBC5763323.1 hypothetical protein [Ramlibacter albus]
MDWKLFFLEAAEQFSSGQNRPVGGAPASWCAWTTFKRLREDAGYWTAPLPIAAEVGDLGIRDGGTWQQPFVYDELAHVIVPRQFHWEQIGPRTFTSETVMQQVEALSARLEKHSIAHRLTDLLLEIKLY